ncbi:TnsD family Tn7-like transposition protein [Deinococcus arenicola]|uniref:TnsD family Tn7-like transposition protein n=1 Tax=Deinococcus arenicola TaxID=2994950 RepID=A0ABU4DP15_9DEIO|nr:TnsD family Tn7-like transposition protein [Deinococcus sp. ZS9-10]MDV6374172.1 TnsD family Tn7-like transposition protein [Deinococcus sp. ZS9-10]
MIYWETIISTLFPQFYPGELCYGAISRYQSRLGLSDAQVQRSLYNQPGMVALADLPTHISILAENLPPWLRMTTKQIIRSHTLFKYYSAFLDDASRDSLTEVMLGSNKGVQSVAGLNKGNFTRRNNFRYCPVCVARDRQEYGEAYWHVVHQATTSWFCYKHRDIPLIDTVLEKTTRSSLRTSYITIESLLIDEIAIETPEIVKQYTSILKDLSSRTAWLFKHSPGIPGRDWIRINNVNIMADMGFAGANHRVDYQALLYLLQRKLPLDLLFLLGLKDDQSDPYAWFYSLFAASDRKMPAPLLIFTSVCDISLSSYFSQKNKSLYLSKYKVAKEERYLCHNKICQSHLDKAGKLISICGKPKKFRIECERCGFIYDTVSRVNLKLGKIYYPGQLWLSELSQLAENFDLSLQDISEKLDSSCDFVERQATVLGIRRFALSGKRKIESLPDYKFHKSREKRDQYRETIIHMIGIKMDNSELRIKETANKEYRFLMEHDRVWLYSNIHIPLRRDKSRKGREDTAQFERILIEGVEKCAEELACENVEGLPSRIVSRNAIIKRLSDMTEYSETAIKQHLIEMPDLLRRIDEHDEGVSGYHIRKLFAVFMMCLDAGELASAKGLLRRAGIKSMYHDEDLIFVAESHVRALEKEQWLKDNSKNFNRKFR